MRIVMLLLPALLAGAAAAQDAGPATPAEPQAKVPPVQYRSAFEGYRPFVQQELRDWRKSNDEVEAAATPGAHRPAQSGSQPPAQPQPGKPSSHEGHR
jgi:hypothetical protein